MIECNVSPYLGAKCRTYEYEFIIDENMMSFIFKVMLIQGLNSSRFKNKKLFPKLSYSTV